MRTTCNREFFENAAHSTRLVAHRLPDGLRILAGLRSFLRDAEAATAVETYAIDTKMDFYLAFMPTIEDRWTQTATGPTRRAARGRGILVVAGEA